MSKEMLRALAAIEEEKGVKQEIVIDALERALVAAYKRYYGQSQNVKVTFNEKTGDFKVFQEREVVDMVFDSNLEISLEDAHEMNKHYEIGDKIKIEKTPKDFGRIAAQTAKQVIVQTVHEEERSVIYKEYSQYENDIMTGTVERMDNRYIYVNLGKIEAVMQEKDRIPKEKYQAHDRIKVYVYRVNKGSKGPQINVSRSHPDLVRRLLENEVPEIYDGTIEIVNIAREPGERSKISVYSNSESVDAIGTVVGPRGSRIQAIQNELHGEFMDVIYYSDDAFDYISNALRPAEVVAVYFEPENDRAATVFVQDHQLSLAIGKRGQNARLAARLTGYRIDIKRESEIDEFLVEYNKRIDDFEAKYYSDESAVEGVAVEDEFLEFESISKESELEVEEVYAEEESRTDGVEELSETLVEEVQTSEEDNE
ncbi:MAG: transcription termination factor NusA [Streptococcaceae bacterium]|jgi:N utilization substance protein A|nr:transcription termination factor NusA [Streptococcaceae bacterium]